MPPSEAASGAPVSRVCSSASSRACSRMRRAPAFSSAPRASGAVRAQAACAARAASTARCASGAPPAGTWPIARPVAGSRTSSPGSWALTPKSSVLISSAPTRTRARGVEHLWSPAPTAGHRLQNRCRRDEDWGWRRRVMTTERTQAYGRVVQTLAELGPAKLLPAEQARIREAADTLIFASNLDEATGALRDIGALAEHLLESGRWLEERIDMLVADLL